MLIVHVLGRYYKIVCGECPAAGSLKNGCSSIMLYVDIKTFVCGSFRSAYFYLFSICRHCFVKHLSLEPVQV